MQSLPTDAISSAWTLPIPRPPRTVHSDLSDSLERDGRRFEPEEPGIRCCRSSGLLFYAVNLSLFSGAHPHNSLALPYQREELLALLLGKAGSR